jgi:type I restriction enzyme S subunit
VPEECTIPWFTLGDIWQVRQARKKYVRETNEKISPTGIANSAARLLPAGTVILSRTASVGFPAILAVPMATTQDFANWICGPQIVPEYLYFVLRAMCPELHRLMIGSTHQTIYLPDVHAFRMPLPPLEEQAEIVSLLMSEEERIDALMAKKERAVELLSAVADEVIGFVLP